MTRGNSLSWHSLAVGFSPPTEVASWAGSFFPRREALKVAAASRSYLCLNADGAGDRKLRFPKAAEVFDPFTGERLARRVTNFTRTLQNRETLLIRYKT